MGEVNHLTLEQQLMPYLHPAALVLGKDEYRYGEGHVLMVDIAGFTSWNERQGKGGRAGIRALKQELDRCISVLEEKIVDSGGELISFEGDALTALFYSHEQAKEAGIKQLEAARGGVFGKRQMHIGVASGTVLQFVTMGKYKTLITTGTAVLDAISEADAAGNNDLQIKPYQPSDLDAISKLNVGLVTIEQLLPFVDPKIVTREDEWAPAGVVFGNFRKVKDRVKELDLSSVSKFVELVSEIYDIVRSRLEDYGLHIDKFWGDKYMATTATVGTRKSTEIRAMIESSLKIKDDLSELGVDIGHWYDVVFRGNVGKYMKSYTVLGPTANRAARAMGSGSGVVVPVDIAREVNHQFDLDEPKTFDFKGVGDVELQKVKGILELSVLEEDYESSSFLGRDDEYEALENWVGNIGNSKASASMLLVGEAGIGKSRIVRELSGKDATFFSMSALSYRKLSFLPFKELFHKLPVSYSDISSEHQPFVAHLFDEQAPDLSYLGREERKHKTHEAIDSVFSQLEGKNVLVFEDLHWADADSVEALDYLVKHGSNSNVGFLVTSRPEGPGLYFHDSIQLNRIDGQAASDLVDEITEKKISISIKALVLEKAGDNPLFIEQFVAYLKEHNLMYANPCELDVPDDVRHAMRSRIENWTEQNTNYEKVLKRAAVIGTRFTRETLEVLLEDEPVDVEVALHQLQEAQFVRRIEWLDRKAYEFSHSELREACYEMVFDAEKIHEQVGDALIVSYGENEVERRRDLLESVSSHFKRSDVPEKAMRWLYRWSFMEATEIGDYERTLQLREEVVELAQQLVANGKLASDSPEREYEVLSLLGIGAQSGQDGEFEEGLRYVGKARGVAENTFGEGQRCSYYRAWCHIESGRIYSKSQRFGLAQREFIYAKSYHLDDQNVKWFISNLEGVNFLLWSRSAREQGDVNGQQKHLERAQKQFFLGQSLAEEIGSSEQLGDNYTNLCEVLKDQERYREAGAYAELGLREKEKSSGMKRASVIASMIGVVECSHALGSVRQRIQGYIDQIESFLSQARGQILLRNDWKQIKEKYGINSCDEAVQQP